MGKGKGISCVICGPRDFYDYDAVCKAIQLSGFEITEVVSGGATGVDRLGEKWAKENKVKCQIFPAEWDNLNQPGAVVKTNNYKKEYNANAGFYRNKQMAEYAQAVIAIVVGSPGTDHMVKEAKQAGLKVYEYSPNQDQNIDDETFGYVF